MDSIPAIPFSLPSLPSLSSLKTSEPETKAQHVEDTTSTAESILSALTNGHLPRGVLESEEEKDKKWYIGSVDCGTTSSRFLIFDGTGNPAASHQIEFPSIYPDSGWHEQDPIELFAAVSECIDGATKQFLSQGHTKDQIKTIGITTQRETTVCWDSETGEPLYNAVVWPDTRTASLVRELKQREGADKVQGVCGLPISTYPSGVKLLWMVKNVEAVKKAYDEGRLCFGTVDSWLIYKLNGGREANVHVTDSTNASRTMFMNLKTLAYDDTILDFFQLDRKNLLLPKIVPSSDQEAFGKLAVTELKGLSITGCLGDQSAALVGQCGFAPGQAKNTYGTGCFLLYNVGTEPVFSKHGLLATVAYDFGGGRKPVYALEGSVAVAGSGVKFLMNNLGFIAHSSKITELAQTVKDNGGVVFVTAFSGLFAPYWIDDAKGTLFGITAHTQRGHIARATLEATCYQTRAILDAMEKDSGHKLGSLAVDGGMSNSDLTMQTQADILGIKVDRPVMRETTALGAAIAAGLAVGIWKQLDELKEINKDDRTIFESKISEAQRGKMFKKWEQAVQMCRGWVLQDEVAEEIKKEDEIKTEVETKKDDKIEKVEEVEKEKIKEAETANPEETKEGDAITTEVKTRKDDNIEKLDADKQDEVTKENVNKKVEETEIIKEDRIKAEDEVKKVDEIEKETAKPDGITKEIEIIKEDETAKLDETKEDDKIGKEDDVIKKEEEVKPKEEIETVAVVKKADESVVNSEEITKEVDVPKIDEIAKEDATAKAVVEV